MATDGDKKHKDILGALFQDQEQVDDPKLRELLRFAENRDKSLRASKLKSNNPGKLRRKRRPKVRSSSYISIENFKALDQAKADCQRLLMDDKKVKISKSRITEIALEIILRDFQFKRDKSILANKLKGLIESELNK